MFVVVAAWGLWWLPWLLLQGSQKRGTVFVAQHERLLVEKTSLQLLSANPPIPPKCCCDTDAGEPLMKKWSDMRGRGAKRSQLEKEMIQH